jgi:hypothetical protein
MGVDGVAVVIGWADIEAAMRQYRAGMVFEF